MKQFASEVIRGFKLDQIRTLPLESVKARLDVCSECCSRNGLSCRKISSRFAGALPVYAAQSANSCSEWSDKPAAVPTVSGSATSRQPIVILTPSLGYGGAEEWVIYLARYLDFDVTVVVTDASSAHADMQRRVTSYSKLLINGRDPQSALAQAANRAKVILTWGFGAEHLKIFTYGSKAPIVWAAQGACQWTATLLASAVPMLSGLVGVSDICRRIVPDGQKSMMKVIYNGSHIERTVPILGRDAMRKRWGVNNEETIIGYIGRLSPEKNVAGLVEMAAVMPKHYRLVMVGTGWQEAETKALAEQKAPGRVLFVGRHAHVGDALAAVDVWANISPSEGFSLSMIEAWMAGTPCVSTPTGAVPELTAIYGTLVSEVPLVHTPIDVLAAIEKALSKPFKMIVDKARKIAIEKFNAAASAWRWQEYLAEFLPVDAR